MGRFTDVTGAAPVRAMRSPRAQRSARKLAVVAFVVLFVFIGFLSARRGKSADRSPSKLENIWSTWILQTNTRKWRMPPKPSDNYRYSAAIVSGVLSDKPDEAAWVNDVDDIERKAIYVVDDPTAPLHLERNHGRESMVYLQYILEHYDNLTDVTFFMHAHHAAWHNNLILRHHALPTLNLLRRSTVLKQGYVNTRCDLHPGCPRWIKFDPTSGESQEQPTRIIDIYNSETFAKLYPDVEEVPQYLAAPCCAQFAVSKETIQAVPLETYKRIHHWIRDHPFDGFTGRFMEYTWQYLFLGKEELCPSMTSCYCELYGICDLDADLLQRWQNYQVRANEIEDRSALLRNQYVQKPNQSVDDNEEYQTLRKAADKIWKQSNMYGEQVYSRFAIPPVD